jgi:acyl-CoA thioesterase
MIGTTMDPQQTARKSADAMWASDNASRALGMQLQCIGPGRAVIGMLVTEAMTNGHGMCHGGYIFTLADTAFAYACNSHNQRTVAAGCQISYLAPVKLGAGLIATAHERVRAERSGITDVTVTDQSGAIVAEFRGNSRTIAGTLF